MLINVYKNNLIAENKIITASEIFAVVMPPYLTFTTAKVKIKLPSYFFLIPMAGEMT